jgi:hypothetical protein
VACARNGGQAILRLFALDHCQLPPKGFLSMRQIARAISPIVGIVSFLVIGWPVVALGVGDLSSQEAVSGSGLSAAGSAGHHEAARCLVNASFATVER